MDITQTPANVLGQNMMNLEPLDNLGPKFNLAMETEETTELDRFDRMNKHNPQMVSVFAKIIFDYLRDKEVGTTQFRTTIFLRKATWVSKPILTRR